MSPFLAPVLSLVRALVRALVLKAALIVNFAPPALVVNFAQRSHRGCARPIIRDSLPPRPSRPLDRRYLPHKTIASPRNLPRAISCARPFLHCSLPLHPPRPRSFPRLALARALVPDFALSAAHVKTLAPVLVVTMAFSLFFAMPSHPVLVVLLDTLPILLPRPHRPPRLPRSSFSPPSRPIPCPWARPRVLSL